MAEGLTSHEIASRLGCSFRTVQTHSSAILLRLDANNRTHAVVRAFRLGLIDVPEGLKRIEVR